MRRTGPSKATLELVHNRAFGLCEICGFAEHQQTHHRLPRRAGGTKDPAINLPSNLLALCALDHSRTEMNRTEALRNGWLVSSWEVPIEKPVFYRGTWRLLDDEGGWVIHSGTD